MDKLIPFNYNNIEVRTILKDNEPWFVASDVCNVLEISNVSDALSRLDTDEKGIDSTDTLGGKQSFLVVNEPGLYSLVLGSRKPEAKSFKRWITHEVIPSIRKHGLYATEELLNNPDLAIKAFTALKEEREKRKLLETQVEEQRPLVLFAESCIASNDCLLVREVAKLASKNGISIGEKRLWAKLREWGKVNKDNEPYQSSMDAGYFEIKQGTYMTPYGSETYRTPKVTPKGQVYIIERLRKEKVA